MKLYRLETSQRLPLDAQQAWEFFSTPANLAAITPPWLGFEIADEVPESIYPGLIIRYRVRPFANIPVDWVTEVTHVERPGFFVDEQRFGPYRFWQHQHRFRPCAGGIEMLDLVHYALPLGPGGRLLQRFVVAGRLEEIFAYRRRVLSERFLPAD